MSNSRFLILIYLGCNFLFTSLSLGDDLVPSQSSPVEFSQTASTQQRPDEALRAFLRGDLDKAESKAQAFLQENPNSSMTHELIGAIALAKKNYPAAESSLNKAVELDPDSQSALIRYGQAALESGNPQIAGERFSAVVQKWPDLGAGYRNLSLALSRQGKFDQALAQIEKALKLSEKADLEALYLKASFLHESRRPGEAEYLLSTVLKEKPDFLQAVLLQGIVKLELKKMDEAAGLLEQVIAKDPQSPWARLGMAVIARTKGDNARAEEMLSALTREFPQWTLAQFQLAETFLMAKKVDRALEMFQQSEAGSKNRVHARINAGWVLLKYDAKEQALEKAKSAVSEADTNLKPAAYNLLVRAARVNGGSKQWKSELLAATRTDKSNPFYPVMYLGWFYLNQNQPDSAIEQFEKAVKINPQSEDALLGKAQALAEVGKKEESLAAGEALLKVNDSLVTRMFLAQLYERLEITERAEAAYNEILTANPDYVPAMQARSRMYEKQGDMKKAAEALVAKGDISPENAAVLYFDLGSLYLKTKVPDRAVEAYKRSIHLNPNQPLALNNLAFILGKEKSTIEKAITYADQAYKLAPQMPEVIDTLGWLYGQVGKLNLAESLLLKSITMDENNSGFRYHLGYVYAKQGRKEDAIRELTRAVQDNSFPELEQAKGLLESLKWAM